MPFVHSEDTEIWYEVRGAGPDVVLLHPFPADHGIWLPVVELLSTRYRCVLPDLRGHGKSEPGEGPATMAKHARDVLRVCEDAGVERAVLAGNSIGGYILFEFWRAALANSTRRQIRALVLAGTRAPGDSEEGRRRRLDSIADVQQNGPAGFLDRMSQALVSETTRRNRPDIVRAARARMRSSVAGIAAVQQGMASRPDSVATLKAIDVPTLILVGAEDETTPRADAELMHRDIRGSRVEVVPAAGHYVPFEQPELVARAMRQFLDALPA
jgi:pimeloyl-ACP methyl ester carboxylesterase